MRKVCMDEMRRFTVEQMAVYILEILKRNLKGSYRSAYYGGSINAISTFELAPIWLGKFVEDGVLRQGGGVMSYAGDVPPQELSSLINKAVNFLRQQNFIEQDSTQSQQDFVAITDDGWKVAVDDNTFTFVLARDSAQIYEWYKEAVFLVEVKNAEGDLNNGSAFFISDDRIVTCKHNLEGKKDINIYLDEKTPLSIDMFDIKEHGKRDMVILKFKSLSMAKLLRDIKPIPLAIGEVKIGASVLSLGYPRIPGQHPVLAMCSGILSALTRNYNGEDFLNVTASLTGGYSGGPLLDKYGQCIGMVTEAALMAKDTASAAPSGDDIYRHATPIKYINDII